MWTNIALFQSSAASACPNCFGDCSTNPACDHQSETKYSCWLIASDIKLSERVIYIVSSRKRLQVKVTLRCCQVYVFDDLYLRCFSRHCIMWQLPLPLRVAQCKHKVANHAPALQQSQYIMIELRHLDVRHIVIEDFRHLAKGCTAKCAWLHRFHISYIYHRGLCLGAILCTIITIGCVSAYARRVCDALVASCATVH